MENFCSMGRQIFFRIFRIMQSRLLFLLLTQLDYFINLQSGIQFKLEKLTVIVSRSFFGPLEVAIISVINNKQQFELDVWLCKINSLFTTGRKTLWIQCSKSNHFMGTQRWNHGLCQQTVVRYVYGKLKYFLLARYELYDSS